ncbi:MAG: hypothetical protein IJQ23_05405, partial [Clostridia bacterium]|nr:hypothetical protein [Clostridia bacterium]
QNSEITIDPAIQYSQGVETFLRILSVFNYVLRLANVFVTVSVYIYLFRKFWPEHYILVSVLSVFGLFPIFVFATRNRKAVDYAEYVRNRFYGSGYTPYGRNGGNNGAYGNNSYGANAGRDPYDVYGNGDDKEPFGEFSNRPEEPFGEFSDGKNGGDNGYGNDDNEDR